MRSNHKYAYLALIIAPIIWGATIPLMKITLQEIPIFSLAFIRFFAASLLFLPFIWKELKISKQHIPHIIIVAVLGITLHMAFFFAGLKYTTALDTGIIVATLPILLLFFAHIYLKEKINKKIIIGGIIGTIGVGIIIAKDYSPSSSSFPLLGNSLILLSTICFVFYEIISKKLYKFYKPSIITFYSFLIGSILFIPAVFMESQKSLVWLQNLSQVSILGLIYGTIFSSFIAFSLWQWGLSKLEASRVGFFFYIDPLATTLFSVLLLSEKITLPFLIGGIFIFIGLFIAEKRIHHYHLLKTKS